MFLTAQNFDGDKIIHGFFTRNGGASEGIFASLNCGYGSGDKSEDIIENRKRVAEALGVENLLTVYQIHSPLCAMVREPWERGNEPKVDAMVTDRPGLMLGILTADCGPVLFQGTKHDGSPVIGAAHAGWGGAVGGVLENTIQAMLDLGVDKESLRAALGPCIGPESYEVSDGFEEPFLAHDARAARFFKKGRAGHAMFDLPSYIEFRLSNAGISSVSILRHDTYKEESEFFSYRRATHRGEKDYGRQISVIAITS